jgi:hypothetical protein
MSRRIYALLPLAAMMAFFLYYADWSSAAIFRRSSAEVSRDPYAGRDGTKEARGALKRGKLLLLSYGLLTPYGEERREIARTKFGIEYRVIAGCVVSEDLVRFATDYNRVMEAAIVSQFGSGVFDVVNRAFDF